jgi:hypothetical protein
MGITAPINIYAGNLTESWFSFNFSSDTDAPSSRVQESES